MTTARRTLAIAAAALVLATPAPGLGQAPGDEQYTDPFGGSPPAQPEPGGSDQSQPSDPGAGGGSKGSQGGGTSPAPSPPVAPAPSSGPDSPVSSSAATGGAVAAPAPPAAAETLPATGVDVRVIALVGAILLAAGLALRRRVRVRR